MNRRSFLQLGGLGLVAVRGIAYAGSSPLSAARPRALSLHNLHTDELLHTTYWAHGKYVPESLTAVNRVLRDHRNGEIHEISPELLDTLYRLSLKVESKKSFEVISGYRSPATNARLRREGHNVAAHSLHMDGLAIDIRVPGLRLATLRKAAVSLKAGGVGYYPKDGFVHVDVGRVRYW